MREQAKTPESSFQRAYLRQKKREREQVRVFRSGKVTLQAAADFLEQAGEGEYCFVENTGLQAVEAKIEKIIVFWWNRHYPSDRKFDLDLSKWNKVSEEEFAGYSHEKITKEVYEK